MFRGKSAGALSQIAYLVMGLTLLPVFAQGGGIGYVKLPNLVTYWGLFQEHGFADILPLKPDLD
ncbi:hypothetical protein CRD_00923 [Raphidiopsis brookii D9]|nr:hypothetical protein CRD_00923 [Raphidiopsis brookii D9]